MQANTKRTIVHIAITIFLVMAVVGLMALSRAQERAPMGDPLKENEERSLMLLTQENTLSIPDEYLEEEPPDEPEEQAEGSGEGEDAVTGEGGEGSYDPNAGEGPPAGGGESENPVADAHTDESEAERVIVLSTNLRNATVTTKEMEFYARASVDGKEIALLAAVNGVSAQAVGGGNYNAELKPGSNKITLHAEYAGLEPVDLSFSITYDPKAPIVETNLASGRVNKADYPVSVRAWDYRGNSIGANSVTLIMNGVEQGAVSDTGGEVLYRLTLEQGVNDVSLYVKDREGNLYTHQPDPCKITYKAPVSGYATVSVQAPSIGFGTFASGTVALVEGENAVYAVAALLNESSYNYLFSNGVEKGSQLLHIIKEGMCSYNNQTFFSIADALQKLIDEDGLVKTEVKQNSIGVGDFYEGSMFLYRLNGSFSAGNLGDLQLQDGDILEVIYSIAYGREVGAGALGLGYGKYKGQNYS